MEKGTKNFVKNSLAFKCFKLIFSIYFLVNLLITAFQIWAEYQDAEDNVRQELRETKKSFVGGLTEAVWNLDDVQWISLGEGIFEQPIVKGIVIYDDKKEVLFSKPDIKDINKNFQETLSEGFPLIKKDKGKTVGFVTLYSNSQVVFKRVELGLLLLILFAFFKSGLLFFLFFWVFKKRLITPLASLASQADDIKLEKLDKVTLGLNNIDKNELNILEESINEMVGKLKDSRKEIEKSYEQITYMNKKLVDHSFHLEESIKERVKEISEYMDNMNSAVFSIDSELKVLGPVSKYALKLFGRNIEGEKVSKVLFSQLKPGSREYVDLTSSLGLVFGNSHLQFLAVDSKFPKKVKSFHTKRKGGSTLKISYSPLVNSEDIVQKIMIIVEDVTEHESYYADALNDQIKFVYVKELLGKKLKGQVVQKIQEAIEKSMKLLEDFISPTSDTYEKKYFIEETIKLILGLKKELSELEKLSQSIADVLQNADVWRENLSNSPNLNPQIEATEKVCGVLEQLILFTQAFESITSLVGLKNVSFKLKDETKKLLLEKKEDLDKVYKNIFEYIFLIRTVDQIDDKKLSEAVNIAKLYPDFERTMSLVYQRSKFISFIYKIQMNNEGAEKYGQLANLVKGMPNQRLLDPATLKYSLIDPYIDILKMSEAKES